MNKKIKIIEAINAGYVIKHMETQFVQVIPAKLLLKRIKWGIYTLINPEMIKTSQKSAEK